MTEKDVLTDPIPMETEIGIFVIKFIVILLFCDLKLYETVHVCSNLKHKFKSNLVSYNIVVEEVPHSSVALDDEDKEEMLKTMDTEDVILYLRESSTLSEEDKNKIEESPVLKQPRVLVDIVRGKGHTALLDLIEALEATEQINIAEYVKTYGRCTWLINNT